MKLKKIFITTLALFLGGTSIANASTKEACNIALNSAWQQQQQRFENNVKFKEGLRGLGDVGFKQTQQCLQAFNNISLTGGLNLPTVGNLIDQAYSRLDKLIGDACGGAFDKVDEATGKIGGKVNFGESLGINLGGAKWRVRR